MDIRRSARDARRISHIINVLFRNGLGYFVDELDMKYHLSFYKKAMKHKFIKPDNPEVRLKHTFEELGGAFIKLGQLLSIRPDIVPEEYCKELSSLQDKLPSFPKDEVIKVVEKELKKPIKKVFKEFDYSPISSASIGQVHKAKLINGKNVVVKIRRPGIEKTFEADIDIMHFFAKKLERKKRYRDLKPTDIVKEFAFYTKNELNFLREARFLRIFDQNFSKNPDVIIPKVFEKYTTEKILTMQYIDGVKVKDLTNSTLMYSKKKLINLGIESMISQIFDYNVFHADLHPSNILVLKDNKIAFLDFGIIGVINEDLKKKSIEMILALVTKDNPRVADILLEIGKPAYVIDKVAFTKDVSFILNEWYGKTLREEPATNMMKHLFELCVRYGLRMPRDLVLVGKAAVTIEGTCRLIDPDMDFVKVATPYLRKIVTKQFVPKEILPNLLKSTLQFKEGLSSFPRKISGIMDTIQRGKVQVDINADEVTAITKQISTSAHTLSLGIILAALIISGTITLGSNIPPIVFGYPFISLLSYFAAILVGISFFLRND